MKQQVPALYLSNYSRATDLADELSLVRPDQSYREAYDAQCEELLDNPLAVYMVYTLEEGDDRYAHIIICRWLAAIILPCSLLFLFFRT